MEFSYGSDLEFLLVHRPGFLGQYPEQGLEILGSNVPKYSDADMKIISQPVDFCGLNLYSGYPKLKSDAQKEWVCADKPTGFPVTAFKWPVTFRFCNLRVLSIFMSAMEKLFILRKMECRVTIGLIQVVEWKIRKGFISQTILKTV